MGLSLTYLTDVIWHSSNKQGSFKLLALPPRFYPIHPASLASKPIPEEMSCTYTPSSISAVLTQFTGAQTHSLPQCLATAQAAIRHQMHSDDSDLTT